MIIFGPLLSSHLHKLETIEPDQMSLPIQRTAVDSRCQSHPLRIISLIYLNHAVWLTAQAQDGRVPYNSISASHENDALHMQACDPLAQKLDELRTKLKLEPFVRHEPISVWYDQVDIFS